MLRTNALSPQYRKNLEKRLSILAQRNISAAQSKRPRYSEDDDDCILQETFQEIILIDDDDDKDINMEVNNDSTAIENNAKIDEENGVIKCFPKIRPNANVLSLDYIPLEKSVSDENGNITAGPSKIVANPKIHISHSENVKTGNNSDETVKNSDETVKNSNETGELNMCETIKSQDDFSCFGANSLSTITADETIICLDDDTTLLNVSPVTTNIKDRYQENMDDSIIFVSETIASNPSQKSEAMNFIPLSSSSIRQSVQKKNARLCNIMKRNKERQQACVFNTHTSSKQKPRNIFTASETKKIKQYNTNAYNPNKNDAAPLKVGKRMVLIDGSNVAFQHSLNKCFSVKGLEICVKYFEEMGFEVKAIVPQFRLQRSKSSDAAKLEQLHRMGKIVLTPCKNLPGMSSTSYDDRFLLQLATELDAAIVSNDNYRDLINENPAFKKIIENQVTGYTWCNDIFILPKDPYGRLGPSLTAVLYRT